MLTRIYFAVLGTATLAMIFLTVYANSWFGSIDNPKNALEGYYFYAGLGSTFLWISSAVLLILANIILWTTRRGWPLWTTLAYFAIFVVLRTFWLEKARYNFQNSDSLFFTPVIGVILIIGAGVLIFFNQFANLRLNEKMYPPGREPEETPLVEEEK